MRLTPIQKERLINREKEELASLKRTNDYLVREALKDFLNLEDVNLILKNLPKEQIEKVLTDEHIEGLLTLAEKLYNSLGPGDGPYYEVPFEAQRPGAKKKEVAKISAIDRRRAARSQVHINRLNLEKKRRENYYETYMNLESMADKKDQDSIQKEGRQKYRYAECS